MANDRTRPRFQSRFDHWVVKDATTPGGSKTKKSFKEECDINRIVARAAKHGGITPPTTPPTYADFSNIGSYQDAMDMVIAAQHSFSQLPAVARKRFNNDPRIFLEFVADPSNAEEMVKLGLAVQRPPVPQPDPVAPKSKEPKEPKSPKSEPKE